MELALRERTDSDTDRVWVLDANRRAMPRSISF